MMFLKGDEIETICHDGSTWRLTCKADVASGTLHGYRLVSTARERWEAAHDVRTGEDGGFEIVLVHCKKSGVKTYSNQEGAPFCKACSLFLPTDPRPADEIAALKSGKAASTDAAQWRPLNALGNCDLVKCEDCPLVDGNCHSKDTGYEYRWPSGAVGEGVPEFREKARGSDRFPVVESEHVPRTVGTYGPSTIEGEGTKGAGVRCPSCRERLPMQLVHRILSSIDSCPICHYDKRRCHLPKCDAIKLKRWDHALGRIVVECELGHRQEGD